MEIIVRTNGKEKKVKIRRDATGEDLLEKLEIYPDEAIILMNGTPIPIKEKLDGRNVEIVLFSSKG